MRYTNTYEFLPASLKLTPESVVGGGGYEYGSVQTGYTFGPERKLASGSVAVERGTFYDGHKTTFSLSQGRITQYNSTSHGLSANVRFRWEYQPGSELFVVLNEEPDTLAGSFPALNNRAFIVKINRLLRF